MPYQVSWLIENRVILARHYGVFTGAELRQYLEESMALRDKANQDNAESATLVHTITDARDMQSNVIAIKDVQFLLNSLRQQVTGWSIYVHPNKLERFLAGVGHQFVGVRYRVFATMPEAIDFLYEVDPTLPENLRGAILKTLQE